MRIPNFTTGFAKGLWSDYEQKKHLIGQYVSFPSHRVTSYLVCISFLTLAIAGAFLGVMVDIGMPDMVVQVVFCYFFPQNLCNTVIHN